MSNFYCEICGAVISEGKVMVSEEEIERELIKALDDTWGSPIANDTIRYTAKAIATYINEKQVKP